MGKDFFDYFPAAPQHQQWGVYATSFGQVQTAPRHRYPSTQHPKDHFLSWEKGRVLHAYQLLYLSAGRGQFESEHSSLVSVGEGSLMVLFPGVWHRYRPASVTGWTESWIELQGDHVEELRRLKILEPSHPVQTVGVVPEILAAFVSARHLAQTKPPGFQVRIGLLGLQILTHLAWRAAPARSASGRLERIVREATHLLSANLNQPLSPEDIARDLHVGYSYFRRIFKTQTGFSPQQYRLEIRLRRTCDFLRNTELTIKEIAEQLGYDSPYHLSIDFKRRMGVAPQVWRRQGSSKV